MTKNLKTFSERYLCSLFIKNSLTSHQRNQRSKVQKDLNYLTAQNTNLTSYAIFECAKYNQYNINFGNTINFALSLMTRLC